MGPPVPFCPIDVPGWCHPLDRQKWAHGGKRKLLQAVDVIHDVVYFASVEMARAEAIGLKAIGWVTSRRGPASSTVPRVGSAC